MQRTPNCPNCFRNFGLKEICKTKNVHIPLLLECGHTFCDSCIVKLARLHKTQIICPECQHLTPLSTEGVAGVRELQPNICIMGVLAANFYKRSILESIPSKSGSAKAKVSSKDGMKQAVAQIAKQKKAEELTRSAGLKCEECFRVAATSRCNKCECVFCALCFEKVHSSSHTLRRHKPYPITKTSSEPESGCPDHKNRPYEFFDKTDNQPVCSHCVVVGERQGHNIVPITDMVDDLKEHFKSSFEDGQNIVKHLENSQKKLCRAVSQVKSEKTQLASEIREHFHYLCALLQLREMALIKELETHHGNEEKIEMTITENIRKSRNVLQELEEVIVVPTKLISKSKELMEELQSLKDMPCVAVTSKPEEQFPKFGFDKDHLELISSYGSVQNPADISLELKKLSEVEESDLREDTSDEEEPQEPQEAPQEPQENKPDGSAREPPASMPRSIAAAKLLSIPFRHELVQVTHIRDPCYFMVQRLADLEQVNAMMNALQLYCEATDAEDLVFEVNIGDMVCAQFSVDNLWYRARVITIYSDKNSSTLPTIDNGLCIEVVYMDFGNTEWVPLMRLRKMPAQFLEVPDLAVNCSLMDIVPPFKEEKWPSKAIKAFGSLTGDKPLLMTVLRRRGGSKLYIDLKNPDNDEPTHDDDRPASVRDALVFLEVARFTSPASAPDTEGRSMFPMRSYKGPILVEEGKFVDVLVTHVTGPDELYLQKLRSEEMKELTHIMSEMMKLYSVRKRGKDGSHVLWPYRGLVCAARFSEDKVWYRALVTAVYSDERVDVTYVDYGNSERVPFSEIRKLPDTFLKLPKQAIPAYLEDVKPAGEQTTWSDQVREFTCDALLNKSVVAQVKSITNGTMAVTLHDTSTESDVCINTFLVMSRHAQSCGLGIVEVAEETETSEQNEQDVQTPEESASEQAKGIEESEQQPNGKEEKEEKNETNDDGPEVEVEEEEEDEEKPEVAMQEQEVRRREPEVTVSKRDVERLKPVLSAYKPAVLPQTKQFQAGVTYVGLNGCIYAQEMKDGDQTLINVMKGLMARYTDNPDTSSAPTSVDDISVGQACSAQFADDSMWYRAVVTEVKGNNRVEVNYVDFGNSEVVPFSALRMEMPYLDVPRQCLQLQLYGVVPATPDGSWSQDIISVVNSMVVGRDCMALNEGESIPGNPLQVRLCLPEGVSMTDSLLARGLVRPSGAAAKVKPSIQALPAGVRTGTPPKSTKEKPQLTRAQAKIHAMLISAREADSMVSRTELPEVGVTFDVTVTHVDEPDCVFVQRVPPPESEDMGVFDADPSLILAEDELERLEQMAFKINEPEYFKNYDPLATAKQGMLCCGRYTEDEMWYRAQVLSVKTENPLSAHVRYIDYGNSEVLPGSRLRGFPSELLDLPIQSIRCRLADIQPPVEAAKAAEGSQWPAETKELLIQIVAGKTLEARIVCVGPPVCILLYDHMEDESGAEKEVSIGKTLSEQKLATYIGADAASNVGTSAASGIGSSANTNILAKDHTNASVGGSELGSDDEYTKATEGKTVNEKSQEALLEKILNPKVGFTLVGSPVQLLTPQEFAAPKKVAANFNAPPKIPPASKALGKETKALSEVTMATSPSKSFGCLTTNSDQGGHTSDDQGGQTLDDQGETAGVTNGSDPDSDPENSQEKGTTKPEVASHDPLNDVSSDVTESGEPEVDVSAVESSV